MDNPTANNNYKTIIMMNKATNRTARTLRLGLVAVVSGLMVSLSANVLKAGSLGVDNGSYHLQEQHAQLSELYVSQRDSKTPKVSLHVENMLLIDVLHKLANELNVDISINTSQIDDKTVSYQVKDKYLFDVLDDLLNNTNLKVTLSDNQRALIVYEKEEAVEVIDAFQGSVRGTVTDSETGEELIGVNIIIPSLNIGVATDVNGTFVLDNVPAGEYRIEARFVGFTTVRRTITVTEGQESVLNIQMSISMSELDELVVTAFGVERARRSIGYSIQDVSSEDISRAGSNNLLNALQGQVSGVQINRGGGGAGQGSQIFIRGFTSLDPSADNQPLFVVDGVPIDNSTIESAGRARGMSNRAIDINPNDIESVSVLKKRSCYRTLRC